MRLAPLLALVVALAACDAGTPAGPTLTVGAPLSAVDGVPSTPPLAVDVSEWFVASNVEGGLLYQATSSDPAVASAAVSGSTLTVTFLSAGRTAIRVTALADGVQATTSLAVSVGLGPGPGEADFLPMAEGTVWDYDYTYETACPGPTTTRAGRVTLAFVEQPAGVEGEREIAADLRAVYTQRVEDGGSVDETTVDETTRIAILETGAGVQLGVPALADLGVRVPFRLERYHPAELAVVLGTVESVRRYTLRREASPTFETLASDCAASPVVALAPRGA